MEAVADEFDGDVDALQEAFRIDAAEDEATFIEGFGALGGSTDTHCRERMAHAREEGGFFR